MNKILYKLTDGKPSFWLMRDYPIYQNYQDDQEEYNIAVYKSECNAIEIINAVEQVGNLLSPFTEMFNQGKDGDIFPFPDSLEFKEEEIEDTPENYKKYGERFGNPIKVIRLIPKHKEESQDELWKSLFWMIENRSSLQLIKSKFTISRKP